MATCDFSKIINQFAPAILAELNGMQVKAVHKMEILCIKAKIALSAPKNSCLVLVDLKSGAFHGFLYDAFTSPDFPVVVGSVVNTGNQFKVRDDVLFQCKHFVFLLVLSDIIISYYYVNVKHYFHK